MENIKIKEITQEKLVDMTAVIINALKNAHSGKNNIDWHELEEEWLEWLQEQLIEEKNKI